MAGEWDSTQLGALAADHQGAVAIGPFGSAMKADVYSSTGVPVIRGTNISSSGDLKGDWVYIPESFADAMPRCVVRGGDIVFPHRGSIGEVALVPSDRDRYFMSTSLMKITLDCRKADPRFVTYYFKSKPGRDEIMRFASQVGTPGIGQPLASLRKFLLPTPPVGIQRSIADILSALDDKVQLSWRMADTLETIARVLFKSWFVDFDPVHARLQGRPTGLPDDVAALFPHSFGEDGIPNGWSIGRLERLIELAYGKSLVAERREAGTVAVYGSNGRVGQHNVALVNGPGIVVGRKGNPGTVTYVNIPFFPIDTTFYVVPRRMTPISYLWLLLENVSLEKLSADSAVPGLNREAAYSVQIVEPPSAIVQVFDEVVSALLARATSARDEAQTLADLRDALLPKLISGELRVVRPEAQVSAA